MMPQRTLFTLVCMVAVAVAVGVTAAFDHSPKDPERVPPPPDQTYLTDSENADLKLAHELTEDILTGMNANGEAIQITNAHIRMYIGLMEGEDLAYHVRRYALGGASAIWRKSPHITNEQADWLEDALVDLWLNDSCEKIRDLAEYLVVEEMDVID